MAGAVDHPIDATVPVEGLSDEGLQVRNLRDRSGEPEAPELLRQVFGPARGRHEHHRVAAARELPGAGGAYAAPGRRYYRRLPRAPSAPSFAHPPAPFSDVA